MKDNAARFGMLKSRNLTVLTSTSAIKIETAIALAKKINMDIIAAPIPANVMNWSVGRNILTSRVMKTSCLTDAPSSIKARCRPEYSRIIVSCTIVSSRCVDGSSIGILDVSTIIITTIARNTMIKTGWERGKTISFIFDMIIEIEVDPLTNPTVKIETRMEGSDRAEMIDSRLLPIPPNVLAVSRPARIMKNLPVANI